MAQQQLKKTALYCRLSKDDERLGESASIETQKTLLTQYAKENGFCPVEFYVDDGYTGLNFNRPAFQRMIDDIALGKIDTVITKDLSRLGRDHIKTGEYSEIYFPTHKVRYIAINDQYDTSNQQSTYYGSIKTAINEFYSRDTSVKIRASHKARAKAGKYMSSAAPFGYIKDPADHNHLIPDPETAHYIVKIYDLVLKGWGNYRIRDYLRINKVPIPSWFQYKRGYSNRAKMFPDEESKYIWRPDTLRNIIRNQVYCGDTVNCKSEMIFKTKKHPKLSEESWIVVKDTHQPLVSREDWERANQLVAIKRMDYKATLRGEERLFAGLLKCADCGKALSKRNYGSASHIKVYVCGTYATYGACKCSGHKIFEDDLIAAVTADIRKYAAIARSHPEELISRIVSYHKAQTAERPDMSSESYKKLQKRASDLEKVFDKLYEDHLSGRLTLENFDRLGKKYQQEQQDIKEQMALYEAASTKMSETLDLAERAAQNLAKYANFDHLTSEMLYALIDRIEVCEPVIVDGKVEQTIRIKYRFAGELDRIEFDATNYYKRGEISTVTAHRAARTEAKRRMAKRVEVVLAEK